MSETLTIAGREFRSRPVVGTGKYRGFQEMQRCHEASGAEMVTVAVRTAMLARAMKLAVESGRLAYESGRMPRKLYASASSPLGGSGGFVGS
jgi:thiazole synthase ThiGH ThiG subunit